MAAAAPGPRLYCPRRPERTLLYRALADSFERFLGVYEKRFEPTHGYLRRAVAPAVYRYLDCGIFAHGAARAHCAECGHDVLIASIALGILSAGARLFEGLYIALWCVGPFQRTPPVDFAGVTPEGAASLVPLVYLGIGAALLVWALGVEVRRRLTGEARFA